MSAKPHRLDIPNPLQVGADILDLGLTVIVIAVMVFAWVWMLCGAAMLLAAGAIGGVRDHLRLGAVKLRRAPQ